MKKQKPRIEIDSYEVFTLVMSSMTGIQFHKNYSVSLKLTSKILGRQLLRDISNRDRVLNSKEQDNLMKFIRKSN